MSEPRVSWDKYFIQLAHSVSERSTCKRASVGCVLVRDNRIISTGYVGSIRGLPHCIDVGCEIDPKSGGCVRTVHAEQNALIQACLHGVDTSGATAYTTLSPCYVCLKLLINAGVVGIVYDKQYRIAPRFDVAMRADVSLTKI